MNNSQKQESVQKSKPTMTSNDNFNEDIIIDFMNFFGMVFSICSLIMRQKWCAWLALYLSSISLANMKYNDEQRQTLSSFLLSASAIIMIYIQNPTPMVLPWFGDS